jgi:hypothetical protein
MADILDRLRFNAKVQEAGPYISLRESREAQAEAAAEIERLRGVLQEAFELSRMRRWPLVQCVLERAVTMSDKRNGGGNGNG